MLLFARRASSSGGCVSAVPATCSARRSSSILETPWSGATTGDLLSRMMQDADLAGNFYGSARNNEISGSGRTG
jgi:hypothetical protein